MGNIKEINIKNQTHSFFNYIIDIKDFDSSLPKIDKKSDKKIGIYNIRYITIKKIVDNKNINIVNPLYLMIVEDRCYREAKNHCQIHYQTHLMNFF